jgi:hypothetical protein
MGESNKPGPTGLRELIVRVLCDSIPPDAERS